MASCVNNWCLYSDTFESLNTCNTERSTLINIQSTPLSTGFRQTAPFFRKLSPVICFKDASIQVKPFDQSKWSQLSKWACLAPRSRSPCSVAGRQMTCQDGFMYFYTYTYILVSTRGLRSIGLSWQLLWLFRIINVLQIPQRSSSPCRAWWTGTHCLQGAR